MKLNKSMMITFAATVVAPLASQATIIKDSSIDELTEITYICENKKAFDVI